MALQNRVTPVGNIEADSARGDFMGNRGILHGDTKELGRRRWAHDNWIICLTAFRDRQRNVMTPHRYTELFFLDEAVAIAAGHRPCYECRRQDYHAWCAAWQTALNLPEPPRAKVMDWTLHKDRIDRAIRGQRRWRAALNALPDGAFIQMNGTPHLVQDQRLLPWRHASYSAAVDRPRGINVEVLTPKLSVATLRAGFKPRLHATATNPKV